MTYRDATRPCPRCATSLVEAGLRWTCRGCEGVWITRDELDQMARRMIPDLDPDVRLPVTTRATRAPLACPFHGEALRPSRLGGVPVDDCAHGVWFDGDELAQALYKLGLIYAERERERDPSRGARRSSATAAPWDGDEGQPGLLSRFLAWAQRREPDP